MLILMQRLALVLIMLAACGEEDSTKLSVDTSYCESVATWDAAWEGLEDEVLTQVNELRAEGHVCGDQTLPPVGPLASHAVLRCTARRQSMDMATREFFAHVNPDGEQPWDRMKRAGYFWKNAGENIGQGYPTVSQVLAGWLASPSHCQNIMSPNYIHLGVGYYFNPDTTHQHYWTQNFGTPAP